jgi:hypothetical protein
MNKILLSALLSIALLSNSFSQITLNPTITDATCNGICNGSISVTPIGGLGPFSYLWSTGDSMATTSNLCAGNYTVTVTDALFDTVFQSFTITEPTAINLATQGFNASCPASSDGSIVTSVFGGTPPYNYLWSNGISIQSLGNMPAGVYSVTVVDDNGCAVTSSATITSLSNLTVSLNSTNPSCGLADGVITLTQTGGVSPITYTLLGGTPQASNTFTGLAEGNHTVVVTDSVGCVVDKSIDLSEVKLTIDKLIPANCNNQKGEIRMKATGGTPPYTYAWSTWGQCIYCR